MLNITLKNNGQFYSIRHNLYDNFNDNCDLLEEVRKNFFINGERQKNKITRNTQNLTIRLSYYMEIDKHLKWKKMHNSTLIEKSHIINDNEYSIMVYNNHRKISKIFVFDIKHNWIKSEYFLSEYKKYPELTITPNYTNNSLIITKQENSLNNKISYEIFPCCENIDEIEKNTLNSVLGVPEILCSTPNGIIYYCTKEEIKKRVELMSKVKENTAMLLPYLDGNSNNSNEDEFESSEKINNPFSININVNPLNISNNYQNEDISDNSCELMREYKNDFIDNNKIENISNDNCEVLNHENPLDNLIDALASEPNETVLKKDVISINSASSIKPDKSKFETVIERPKTAYTYMNVNYKSLLNDNVIDEYEEKHISNNNARISLDDNNRFSDKKDYESINLETSELNSNNSNCSNDCNELKAYENTFNNKKDISINKSQGKTIKINENNIFYYFGNIENGLKNGHGRTYYENGLTIYEGAYIDDKRNGLGVCYSKDGCLSYVGNWKNNKKNGLGVTFNNDESLNISLWNNGESECYNICHLNNGDVIIFNGNSSKNIKISRNINNNIVINSALNYNEFTKISEFDDNGNLVYTGEYHNGIRNGFGIQYNEIGDIIYKGQWKDNLYNGNGTLITDEGHKIKGKFTNGSLKGYGTEFDAFGLKIYEGNFENSKYNGNGIKFEPDGSYFRGTFRNGVPSKIMTKFSKNDNMLYQGEVINYSYFGKGTLYENGQKIYEGEFKNNKYNGFGKCFKNDELIFEGNFADGKRCGIGCSYIYNIMEYYGYWKDDKYHGLGVLYNNNTAYCGMFKKGLRYGRINEIINGKLYRESIFDNDELIYAKEYHLDSGCLLYEGNIINNLKSGMGATFSSSGERNFEGIFKNGEPIKSMKVYTKLIEDLPACSELKDSKYEVYRKPSNFVVEKNINGGLYSGFLKNNLPNGKGTILYSDHRYTGNFKNGVAVGNGIIYKNNGDIIKAIFSNKENVKNQKLSFQNSVFYYVNEIKKDSVD